MRFRSGSLLLAGFCCIVLAHEAGAQQATPTRVMAAAPASPPAPTNAASTDAPAPQQSGNAGGGPDCTKPSAPTTSVLATGRSRLLASLADNIMWQPRDGRVRFTITSPTGVSPSSLGNLELAVCFGWPSPVYASADTATTEQLYRTSYLRTIARTDSTITYETTLPDELWGKQNKDIAPSLWDIFADKFRYWTGDHVHVYDGLGLVPTVHMRIVGQSHDAPAADPNALDTVLTVGISSRILAAVIAVLVLGVARHFLVRWAKSRKIEGGVILQLITNKNGYASLSQFQILLWTAVIAVGLAYVMTLSGALIDVPNQVLALLGISGFSALSAAYASRTKQEDKQKDKSCDDPNDPEDPDKTAEAEKPAAANKPHAPKRVPKWEDLVVWDGRSEIDITRAQMLVFTVLAASFVVVKIIDESAIPSIPDGVVLLMGLTNGVYVGGKYANGTR